jgi:hypothetical protein
MDFLSLLIHYSSFESTTTDVDIGARNSKVVLIHSNFSIWIVIGLADGSRPNNECNLTPLHSHIKFEALQLCIGLKLLFTLSSFSPRFNRQRLSLSHSRLLNSASPIPWFQVWLWCWPDAEWVLHFPTPTSNSSDELVVPGGSTP